MPAVGKALGAGSKTFIGRVNLREGEQGVHCRRRDVGLLAGERAIWLDTVESWGPSPGGNWGWVLEVKGPGVEEGNKAQRYRAERVSVTWGCDPRGGNWKGIEEMKEGDKRDARKVESKRVNQGT